MEEQKFQTGQYFEDDGRGNLNVINTFNDDAILKENYENKKSDGIGMVEGGWARQCAKIPTFLFFYEPLLQEYHKNIACNPEYAKRCLRTWLTMYPEYYANRGRI